MSKQLLLKVYVLLCCSLLIRSSWALTSLTHNCSTEFIATVENVSTLQAPFHKVRVTFRVEKIIKGVVNRDITLSFVRVLGVHVDENKLVKVGMENGFLCSLEELEE